MTHKRVIFLDIDGVLLPIDALTAGEACSILADPRDNMGLLVRKTSAAAVDALKWFGYQNQALCVVISSWRRTFSYPTITEYLSNLGLTPFLHKDWVAPMRLSSHKIHDVGMWLEEHPKITSAIIIDDHDMIPAPTVEHWKKVALMQVVPDPKKGLVHTDLMGVKFPKLTSKRGRKASRAAPSRR